MHGQLLDVRPKEEFDKLHIRGAHSVPLKEMDPARIVREHQLKTSEPLFVICRNRALASLAAGMLQAAGCNRPVVVEGGMQAWKIMGLPGVSAWRFRFPFFKRKLLEAVLDYYARWSERWLTKFAF